MATFKYTGKSNNGKEVQGVVKALDVTAASMEARKTVDIIESIKEIEETPDFFANLFKQKVDIKQLALVCRQFAIILNAGLPIVTSIRLVGNQTEDKYLKKILLEVSEDVKGGAPIADSFEVREPNMPTTFIETIRAGEASGRLDIAFDRLAIYFTKRSKTSSKVQSALLYPVIVLVLAVIVVAILMVFAVPSFTETFESMGVELPLVTRVLIGMSNFFINWTWLLVIICIVAYLVYRIYLNTENGRYDMSQFALKIPVLGKVRKMSSASEFANSFSTMLAAGLPAIKALNITGRSISNYSISQDVLDSCTLVEGGYKIGDSLKEKTNLPDLLLEIVGVGENSGSLESTLATISEFYDNEVDTATTNAVTVLEPAMIIVLAAIVLFILLAVYLPMFSMYGSI